jgi:hypothetical protein
MTSLDHPDQCTCTALPSASARRRRCIVHRSASFPTRHHRQQAARRGTYYATHYN